MSFITIISTNNYVRLSIATIIVSSTKSLLPSSPLAFSTDLALSSSHSSSLYSSSSSFSSSYSSSSYSTSITQSTTSSTVSSSKQESKSHLLCIVYYSIIQYRYKCIPNSYTNNTCSSICDCIYSNSDYSDSNCMLDLPKIDKKVL